MFINSAKIPALHLADKINQCNNKYPNLSPLNSDIVSFSGGGKLSPLDMVYSPTEKSCRQIATNAEPSRFYLNKVLDTYLAPNIPVDKNQKPTMHYTTRVKSPISIREKVVSKYAKNHKKDVKKFTQFALSELRNSFSYSDGIKHDDFVKDAANHLETLHSESKISPGDNIDYYFNELISYIIENNALNLSDKTSPKQKQIFDAIRDELYGYADELKSDSKNPVTIDGIKHYANDIVGARIITDNSGPKTTEKIFNALKQAVDDGVLKITSIESTLPDSEKLPIGKSIANYEYATDKQLADFAKDTGAELITNKSPSGYLSIHINVDLTDKSLAQFGDVYNGYSGEIQILDANVEHLKNVEDLCYKLKDNKSVVKDSYIPFKNHFLKYYNSGTKKAFQDYTYALYLAQREANSSKCNTKTSFPTLKDLGFDDKLPPELDFNNLEQIKKHCDCKQHKQISIQDEINSIYGSNKKSLDSVKLLKKRISYKFSCMTS